MAWLLLAIRRVAIFVIILLGYLFYRLLGQTHGLASIGLVSFAAIAQFAPAFFGGLVWRNATARGAIAGIVTGFRRVGLHAAAALDHRGRLAAALDHDGRPVRPRASCRPQALFYLQLEPLDARRAVEHGRQRAGVRGRCRC